MTNDQAQPLTDEAAREILADQARRVGTLWRALDLDGDDVLSAEEIDRASESLLALDLDGDGQLVEEEFGGPFRYPGGGRASAIVRILDLDGDSVITAKDIAEAPERLRRLDRLGRGHLVPSDDRSPPNPIINATYRGPAEVVAHFDIIRSYEEEPNGPVLPGTDPRQSDVYYLIYEHCNAGDQHVGRDLAGV